jgi:hypothetical protein
VAISAQTATSCALGNPTLHEEWVEVTRDRFQDKDSMTRDPSREHIDIGSQKNAWKPKVGRSHEAIPLLCYVCRR